MRETMKLNKKLQVPDIPEAPVTFTTGQYLEEMTGWKKRERTQPYDHEVKAPEMKKPKKMSSLEYLRCSDILAKLMKHHNGMIFNSLKVVLVVPPTSHASREGGSLHDITKSLRKTAIEHQREAARRNIENMENTSGLVDNLEAICEFEWMLTGKKFN
ncbi:hypothetical protein CDL15_Pgr025548 [Punica granatum]|uniref:Uncharacterized protein n=1 Tax=Punica granatum TaxID=22663 RepID=A0A218WB28_PUNGR|nr:hypothetical protein CDL15_Pgr025548 [Punica granatum]